MLASRPKTLPAAAAPVIAGAFLAFWDHSFQPLTAAAALVCALLLQIGSNLANDVFDFQRGADAGGRLGPVRVTQTGLLTPREVKTAMGAVLTGAALCGLYLSWISSWWLLGIGLLAILAAVGYSGGPIPFGYHGLGDVFVFVFFGLVAVGGTYYLQAGTVTVAAVGTAAAMGGLITNILVVNNLRDLRTDRKAEKRTLAVVLGPEWTRVEYGLWVLAAYTIPVLLVQGGKLPVGSLAVGLAAPWSVRLMGQLRRWKGRKLNQTLAETGQFALIYALLFGLGGSLFP